MTKPASVYRANKHRDHIAHQASSTRQRVSVSQSRSLAAFYAEIARLDESRLNESKRRLSSYIAGLSRGASMSKEDRLRTEVSEVVGEVRKVLEKVEDMNKLHHELRTPAQTVIRSREPVAESGAELALMIATLKVVESLIRLVGRRRGRSD